MLIAQIACVEGAAIQVENDSATRAGLDSGGIEARFEARGSR